MALLHRAGEITYYEELGVASTASSDEIRDAFRALVRLLHPDQQTDEHLRRIAELQMRKLNRIYAVLSDADRRRHYDDTLGRSPRPPIVLKQNSTVPLERLLARFAWVGAVLIAVAVLAWLSSESPGGNSQAEEKSVAPKPASALPPPDSQKEIVKLRHDLTIAQTERDDAVRELTRLRASYRHQPVPDPPRVESAAPLPAPALPSGTDPPAAPRVVLSPASAAPVRPAAAAPKTFAGFWFYTRPPQGQHNKNAALYLPEFIEANLTEQSGVVHGKYRSRYLIVDRLISPDVNFEFAGTASGTTLACPWSGPGGSKGELTLRVTSDHSMEIQWTATELGSLQGLVSGTAHLTRRLEP